MPDSFLPTADELVMHNAEQAKAFAWADLQVEPTRNLAVVTCMDSRIDSTHMLGLQNGEAHILRNAGGVVTDDVIRSLCLSQRFLETREVLLIHHTDCGLQKVNEHELRAELEVELGIKPPWSFEAFDDPYADVHESILRLKTTPFLTHKDHIRGFVYDVTDGLLHEVVSQEPTP